MAHCKPAAYVVRFSRLLAFSLYSSSRAHIYSSQAVANFMLYPLSKISKRLMKFTTWLFTVYTKNILLTIAIQPPLGWKSVFWAESLYYLGDRSIKYWISCS